MSSISHVGSQATRLGFDNQQSAATTAKHSFFGKTVSNVSRALTPELQRLKVQIKQALGRDDATISSKMLEQAVKTAHSELGRINELYTPAGYPKTPGKTLRNAPDAPTIKEMRSRLETIANSQGFTKSAPLSGMSAEKTRQLKDLIQQNRHDPMFKLMGASKFLGYALKSQENIANAEPKFQQSAATMTTCEKVALFGYTCADYSTLNAALRNGNAGSKVSAYIDHATSAIKKCPPYTDNGGVTMRAIKDPPGKDGWATERYKNNTDVTELAFTSTGVTVTQSTYKMVVTGHGYDVSAFSAWPAETEVLYAPGTTFHISIAPGATNVFHAKEITT